MSRILILTSLDTKNKARVISRYEEDNNIFDGDIEAFFQNNVQFRNMKINDVVVIQNTDGKTNFIADPNISFRLFFKNLTSDTYSALDTLFELYRKGDKFDFIISFLEQSWLYEPAVSMMYRLILSPNGKIFIPHFADKPYQNDRYYFDNIQWVEMMRERYLPLSPSRELFEKNFQDTKKYTSTLKKLNPGGYTRENLLPILEQYSLLKQVNITKLTKLDGISLYSTHTFDEFTLLEYPNEIADEKADEKADDAMDDKKLLIVGTNGLEYLNINGINIYIFGENHDMPVFDESVLNKSFSLLYFIEHMIRTKIANNETIDFFIERERDLSTIGYDNYLKDLVGRSVLMTSGMCSYMIQLSYIYILSLIFDISHKYDVFNMHKWNKKIFQNIVMLKNNNKISYSNLLTDFRMHYVDVRRLIGIFHNEVVDLNLWAGPESVSGLNETFIYNNIYNKCSHDICRNYIFDEVGFRFLMIVDNKLDKKISALDRLKDNDYNDLIYSKYGIKLVDTAEDDEHNYYAFDTIYMEYFESVEDLRENMNLFRMIDNTSNMSKLFGNQRSYQTVMDAVTMKLMTHLIDNNLTNNIIFHGGSAHSIVYYNFLQKKYNVNANVGKFNILNNCVQITHGDLKKYNIERESLIERDYTVNFIRNEKVSINKLNEYLVKQLNTRESFDASKYDNYKLQLFNNIPKSIVGGVNDKLRDLEYKTFIFHYNYDINYNASKSIITSHIIEPTINMINTGTEVTIKAGGIILHNITTIFILCLIVTCIMIIALIAARDRSYEPYYAIENNPVPYQSIY